MFAFTLVYHTCTQDGAKNQVTSRQFCHIGGSYMVVGCSLRVHVRWGYGEGVCVRRALKRKRIKLSIPKPVPIPADIIGPSMAGPTCRDTRVINVGRRHLSRDIGWCRPARANTARHRDQKAVKGIQ